MNILNVQSYSLMQKTVSAQSNSQKQDNVSFGLRNPKAAMNRALELKALYAKQSINYLLPNEVWNDSKVSRAVEQVDKNIKADLDSGILNIKDIQSYINEILPESQKNKILIKDLSEIPDELRKRGMSNKEIKLVGKTGGLQLSDSNMADSRSLIFLPIKRILSKSVYDSEILDFRITVYHELTHALSFKFQNDEFANAYHYENLEDFYDVDFFNKFEQAFFSMFEKDETYDKTERITKDALFDFVKVKSEDDLFNKFSKVLDKITKKEYSDEDPLVHTSKQFFNYCKTRARSEKLAYKACKIMREFEDPIDKPTNEELTSLFYGEMEKFFALKAKGAKTAVENLENIGK